MGLKPILLEGPARTAQPDKGAKTVANETAAPFLRKVLLDVSMTAWILRFEERLLSSISLKFLAMLNQYKVKIPNPNT